jgi:hypothetical protein
MALKFVTNLLGIGASSGAAAAGTGAMGVASAGAAGGIGVATAATGTFAASLWAATWPVLAVVAAIALVAGGVYLLVKNWDAVAAFFVELWDKIVGAFSAAWNGIKNIFAGLPNWVVGLTALFLPLISLPILIIKNWDTIKGFFASLWADISVIVSNFVNWLSGVWGIVVSAFTVAWSYVSNFFTSVWNGIVGIVLGFVNWVSGIWDFMVAGFTTAWGYVYNFFASIWAGIKDIVMGFINWIGGAIELIIAPFRKVAEVVGGVLDGIGGFFKGLIGESDKAGTKINENLTQSAVVNPAVSSSFGSPSVPGITTTETAALTTPAFTAKNGVVAAPDWGSGVASIQPAPFVQADTQTTIVTTPITTPKLDTLTGTQTQPFATTPALAGTGNAPITLSPAKMNSSAINYRASSAFESAIFGSSNETLTPNSAPAISGIDMDDFNEQAAVTFQAAMPQSARSATVDNQRQAPERTANTGQQSIKIENLYVQAEECQTLFDFVKMLMHSVYKPEEAAI